jgi:hypothetical protein
VEKRGVIEPGRTPEEQPAALENKLHEKAAAIADLDNDFRKRAAETTRTHLDAAAKK